MRHQKRLLGWGGAVLKSDTQKPRYSEIATFLNDMVQGNFTSGAGIALWPLIQIPGRPIHAPVRAGCPVCVQTAPGLVFRVQGLGFRVEGLGLRV